MLFHQVRPEEKSLFQSRIAALEKEATYPIGNDFFQIDHGDDYFAFFERLGQMKYYVALDDSPNNNKCDRVAAVGAWVLRQVPNVAEASCDYAWYLCDFKVHPDYQRQLLSLRLLRHAIAQNNQTCKRGYAISMNSGCARANRLVKAFCRFPTLQFRHATNLGIYSLNAASMRSLEPLLKRHRGPISYLSLKGMKDLRLQSSGQTLPLLHVQWGNGIELKHSPQSIMPAPYAGYTHMFCVPEKDEFASVLAHQGIQPGAVASVLSHGMDGDTWQFIMTSDI